MKARLTQGLTTVEINTEKGVFKITHTGNMGNTFDDIDKNLLRMGFLTLDEYREGSEVEEHGSPDYFYEMNIK